MTLFGNRSITICFWLFFSYLLASSTIVYVKRGPALQYGMHMDWPQAALSSRRKMGMLRCHLGTTAFVTISVRCSVSELWKQLISPDSCCLGRMSSELTGSLSQSWIKWAFEAQSSRQNSMIVLPVGNYWASQISFILYLKCINMHDPQLTLFCNC